MQTALHILSLVGELSREIVGGKIVATEFFKKERAAFFVVKKDKTVQTLAFVFHPAGSGVVLAPARKVRPDTKEKPWPIFGLDGSLVSGVEFPALDRIFYLSLLRPDKSTVRLAFEAIGPNGNVWLLDESHGLRGTLRNREYSDGSRYEPSPLPAHRLNPLQMTDDNLATLLRTVTGAGLLAIVDKHILGFNRTMALEAVRRADLDFAEPADLRAEDISALRAILAEMAGRFVAADTGYLYQIRGGLEAYPFKLKSREEQPEKFKTLSLAVLEVIQRRQVSREEETEQQSVLQAVGRAVKRLEKRLTNIETDIAQAADYETFKKLGELLTINRHLLQKGMTSITVNDVYDDHTESITISLDPALPPQENVESYFRKYRKGREGLDLLVRRREITRSELDELNRMLAELEGSYEAAAPKYRAEIASLMPKEAAKRESVARLPYREHTLSTGLTIYIGRDGADNDRTTFEFARPYEYWFHTQQCPGSHVVMKFPNKSFEPSKREIEETAAIAAWHSKARNDSLVPVIYTQRKYVRKPRKAKPGLVTVERETSVMVEPRPAE
ncbi:MAG: NFACT RNA binding domain-containing protein [candidate division Zixibacteria bacterium]|jgi:predicted ribosome quality control (RQC) complex YloA/Tae2 family protein|nr:NFACT RNA binding domain-containing protein [candidate division Zixibacteria bacterium]